MRNLSTREHAAADISSAKHCALSRRNPLSRRRDARSRLFASRQCSNPCPMCVHARAGKASVRLLEVLRNRQRSRSLGVHRRSRRRRRGRQSGHLPAHMHEKFPLAALRQGLRRAVLGRSPLRDIVLAVPAVASAARARHAGLYDPADLPDAPLPTSPLPTLAEKQHGGGVLNAPRPVAHDYIGLWWQSISP